MVNLVVVIIFGYLVLYRDRDNRVDNNGCPYSSTVIQLLDGSRLRASKETVFRGQPF
jgi:hypothetical protein